MAAVRSPNYPQMDLGEALEAIRPAYKAEHRMKMSRATLAHHLGYSSLNGRALAKIGAVRAYGLIEGGQDELRISADAIDCLEAPEGSIERTEAIKRCALKPSIFQAINQEYPTPPSEHNLRFFLARNGYTSEAAGKAAQNYLATMRLVQESGGAYDAPHDSEEAQMEAAEQAPRPAERQPLAAFKAGAELARVTAGMRQSVFPLEEGDVTLIFPANLSSDGYAELAEYMEIFLRRAQRSKRLEEAQGDFRDPPQ